MKKATALTLVLVVMMIVGIGTATLLQARISYLNMGGGAPAAIENMDAWYAAEAGVQYGIAQLRRGLTTSPVTRTVGNYTVNITKTDNGGGDYTVSATVQY